MATHQQYEISQEADNYSPEQVADNYSGQVQDYNDQFYQQSSSSSDEDTDFISKNRTLIKDQDHGTKIYHENTYTKIDQKMHFAKIQHHENQQLIKQKRNKDKVQRATVQQVLDPRTMNILKKMINNGTFTEINGCLSTGKQANVYYAAKQSEQGKKQYAIKIYKTSILVFKDRQRYVQGQFRFRRGYCATNPRKMVKMWAQKQLRNLNRIQGIIPCPVPLTVKSNVLVMDFIGSQGKPAPKLRQIDKTSQQFSAIYLQMLTIMRLLYQQCKLIHADLSQYNLLYYKDKIYVIDVSQSVEHDHPQALSFLERDIKNINDFFNKKGVKVFSQQQVFQFIVSLDIIKGKQRQVLLELIQHYDGNRIVDEAFDKIKIHQKLSSITLAQAQKQIFDNQIGHQTITDIKVDTKFQNKIDQKSDDQSSSESDSSQSNQQNTHSQVNQIKKNENQQVNDDQNTKQKKEGGKQKYQGLSKLQRKHKVKEQKRQKRKQKMPKKQKKKLTKKK